MVEGVRILHWNMTAYVAGIREAGYDVISTNVGHKYFVTRCIRELHYKSINKFGQSFWYNKENRNYTGTYIIFDAMIRLNYMEWLRKNNPDARIIFWYWNQIGDNSKIKPNELKKLDCEVWSYCKEDCEKYNLKYNPTFFVKSLYKKSLCDDMPTYKLCFIGKDKGRASYIMNIAEIIGKNKCYIHIVANQFYKKWTNKIYKRNISYIKTLQIEEKSEAILEIMPGKNAGLTLRTLDALVMKKKLITNNVNIAEYDFYNPNNIYILQGDNESGIEVFFKLPYVDISEEIIESYSVNSWVNRFLKYEG